MLSLPSCSPAPARWRRLGCRLVAGAAARESFRSVGDWEFGVQGGAGAGGAVDGDGAAESFNAVFETGEAGAPGGVGAAVAVVADVEVKDLAGYFCADNNGHSVSLTLRRKQHQPLAHSLPSALFRSASSPRAVALPDRRPAWARHALLPIGAPR